MTGEVKSFNPSTRYGFITSDGVDYRFHFQDWGCRLAPVTGMRVQFNEMETEKGLRATDIEMEKRRK